MSSFGGGTLCVQAQISPCDSISLHSSAMNYFGPGEPDLPIGLGGEAFQRENVYLGGNYLLNATLVFNKRTQVAVLHTTAPQRPLSSKS